MPLCATENITPLPFTCEDLPSLTIVPSLVQVGSNAIMRLTLTAISALPPNIKIIIQYYQQNIIVAGQVPDNGLIRHVLLPVGQTTWVYDIKLNPNLNVARNSGAYVLAYQFNVNVPEDNPCISTYGSMPFLNYNP